MAKRTYEIQSVFNKWLGMKARELHRDGIIRIIEVKDFVEGAPIHEDGSSVYDPRKPLVLFAVCITTQKALKAWNAVLREFDQAQTA